MDEKLIASYINIDLRDFAKSLNIPVESVYRRLRRLGLTKVRRWTEKEDQYLRDHYDSKTISNIAKQLFRTERAITTRISSLGLTRKERDSMTVLEIAQLIGMSETVLYNAVRNGEIEDYSLNERVHDIAIEDVREFVVKNYPYRSFKCLRCDRVQDGDLYCDLHLDHELRATKRKPPYKFTIRDDDDMLWNISNALYNMRCQRKMKQTEIAEILNKESQYYSRIERGCRPALTIEALRKIVATIGCKLTIEIERLPDFQNPLLKNKQKECQESPHQTAD